MKGNTNIQVNGNVYGGIHVHGGKAQLSAAAPVHAPSTGQGAAVAWKVLAGFGWLIVGAFALVGGLGLAAALLVVVLGVLVLALAWWLLCRVCQGVLLTERAIGGSPLRLVFVPNLVNATRALATGERVDQLPQLVSDYDYAE